MSETGKSKYFNYKKVICSTDRYREFYAELSPENRLRFSDAIWGIAPEPTDLALWRAHDKQVEEDQKIYNERVSSTQRINKRRFLTSRGIPASEIPGDDLQLEEMAYKHGYIGGNNSPAVPPAQTINGDTVRKLASAEKTKEIKDTLKKLSGKLSAEKAARPDGGSKTEIISPDFRFEKAATVQFRVIPLSWPKDYQKCEEWLRKKTKKSIDQGGAPLVISYNQVIQALETIQENRQKEGQNGI